jgi:flagellar motor switch protein FliN/FliY
MTPLEEIAPIADVGIDVSVELDRRMMCVQDLLELEEGSVIELTRAAGENLDIYVGGALLGAGEIVLIETSMGVRITGFRSED